ncbi:MAG: diguanylate cyclase domain-containing protein [Thermoanaerobaculia bacterium]
MTWRFPVQDPVVRATAAMTFILALPLAVPIFSPEFRAAYNDTCTTAPFLLLAILTFRWRLAGVPDSERRFWNSMTAAAACWLGQQLLLIATYTDPAIVEVDLLQEILFAGLYLFVVIALDVRPHLEPKPGDRASLQALRHAGTVVFVFGLLAYLVLVPATMDPDSYWAGAPSFTLYVLLDIYLVLRAARAIAGSVQGRWRLIYSWLLATCSAWLILDTVEALMWIEVLPWVEGGTPWDLPWMVPMITLVMTGRARSLVGGDEAAVPSTGKPRQRALLPHGPPILLAMLVPLLHFSVYGLELFDASQKHAHELVALAVLLLLGGLVLAYQGVLETSNRRLEVERREALARIEHQAYHDPLTALPNRRLLQDRFNQAMAQANRRKEGLAILFCDLDDFKMINDSSGHGVGDEILRRIGQRLASWVRSSDTLARVGGDEFVVMASGIETRDGAGELATKISRCLDEPFDVEGAEHVVSASVGVSLYPEDGDNLALLLRRADAAMYEAKGSDGPD